MARFILAFSIFGIVTTLLPARLQAQTSRPAAETLPTAIAQLQTDIRGLRPIQVREAIKKRFGQPSREIGSGIRIPQWDVAGGKLTFHPLRGPTFTTPSGEDHWLLRTTNPARETILSQYEMFRSPDPAGRRPQYWIGDIYLKNDLTYRYEDGGMNLHDRGDQSHNFFILHSIGQVEVEWSKGIKDDTPLESAGDGTIAQLVFHAAVGSASLRCRVVSRTSDRRLQMLPEGGNASFSLVGGWKNFWPVPPADDAEIETLMTMPP